MLVCQPPLFSCRCICFFQNSPFTFIPSFTIPFKLNSLNQIRFTSSISPNLLHMCLHRDHHLHLHQFQKPDFLLVYACCCCSLPTPMTFPSRGSPIFPIVVFQPASPSIWLAVQSLRRGLFTNLGVTTWCVCMVQMMR